MQGYVGRLLVGGGLVVIEYALRMGVAQGLDDFYSIVDMVDTTSPVAQHHYQQQQQQPQPSNAFRRQDARRRSPAGQVRFWLLLVVACRC